MNEPDHPRTDQTTTKTPQQLKKLNLNAEKLRDDGSGQPERRWRKRPRPASG